MRLKVKVDINSGRLYVSLISGKTCFSLLACMSVKYNRKCKKCGSPKIVKINDLSKVWKLHKVNGRVGYVQGPFCVKQH